MAHVLLVNPSLRPETQPRLITDIIRHTFPIGLGHIASFLHRAGWDSEIIDEQVSPLDLSNLESRLRRLNEPRIVGISVLTPTCGRAYQLSSQVKKLDPRATVVLGGIHPTALPEECLGRDGVDVAVRGEGEETFAELVSRILAGRDYGDVRGISYRSGSGTRHNENRPLIEDLDALPPFPYHLFEAHRDRYSGFHTIQTSRGCPHVCIFCSQRSVSGKKYRHVGTERAIHDIKLLVEKYQARRILIYEDNIGADKRRLLLLLDAIIGAGLNRKVSFQSSIRGDHLDAEIAAKLKEANFSLLTFGLETSSERLMRLLHKGETVADVVRAIRLTAEMGMDAACTLIFGIPTETGRDRRETMRLVSSLPIASARFNILIPYPGTPVYSELSRENKIVVKQDWGNFTSQYLWVGDDPPYVPDGTGKNELLFSAMRANLGFYLRPKGLIKLLTKPAAGGIVVALPGKWYLSPFLVKLIKVGLYFFIRFGRITLKMLYERLSRAR